VRGGGGMQPTLAGTAVSGGSASSNRGTRERDSAGKGERIGSARVTRVGLAPV
jgi:hypothetical protein